MRRWLRRLLSDYVPDRIMLARRFERAFGRPLDWKNPKTFNEKLFWLIRYYRTPLVTRLADKYAVRGYVAERIGSEYLNELYGVWDRVEDIEFDRLPDAFALKVNWGWGANVFCPRRAELDVTRTKQQLAAWMRRSHYWLAREWSYKHIKPRIICERLLVDAEWGTPPPDYKFFCFGGEPRFVKVHTDRFGAHRRELLDLDWQPTPFKYGPQSPGRPNPRPKNLAEMVECARHLARGLPFVRVDLYSVSGRTVLGEMTWQPSAGTSQFSPERYNQYWGDQIPLPRMTRSGLSRFWGRHVDAGIAVQ